MELRIRKLNVADYDHLILLWQICGLDYKPQGRDSKESMTRDFIREDTIIFGMFDGDDMIGSIVGTSDGRKGWINRLAIHPDYRGQRLARRLIEECETFLHNKGISVISALIEDINLPSMAAFKHAGYEGWDNIVYFSKRTSDDD